MTRNPALDGLRALAILSVVAVHCRVPEIPGGTLGVDLFFVLSGYLITSLLLQEFNATGSVDLPRFYVKRLIRLWPPLLSMLAAYLCVAPMAWPDWSAGQHLRDASLAAVYLSDYSYAVWQLPRFLLHTWSLAIEEQFYLLWPVALIVLLRKGWTPRRSALMLSALWLGVTLLWRPANAAYFTSLVPAFYRFDTHMTGLLVGCVIALSGMKISSDRSALLIGAASLAVIIGGLLFWVEDAPGYLILGLAPTELAAGGLVLSLLNNGHPVYRLFAWRPAAYLGQISYAVYLWHYPIARFLREDTTPYLTFAITMSLSISIAMLSWHLLERPLARLRHRIGSAEPAAA